VRGVTRAHPTIKGVLFDKDGTLIDYGRTWIPINREVALFAAGGDPVVADRLLAIGGHDPETDRVTPGSELAGGSVAELADLFAAHLGADAPPHLETEIDRLFREGGARHSVLLPGVIETLTVLRQRGLAIGLATNDSVGGLTSSLADHGVLPLLDFSVGCDSGFGTKPEPGMVLAFCAAMGLTAAEVAVVGDSVHDLDMARRAGAGLAVGVLSGTGTRDDLGPVADVLLADVRALLTLDAGVAVLGDGESV
jgi:phosphoglycolate phosphatase